MSKFSTFLERDILETTTLGYGSILSSTVSVDNGLVQGKDYVILRQGLLADGSDYTDFTQLGATSNDRGTVFTYNGDAITGMGAVNTNTFDCYLGIFTTDPTDAGDGIEVDAVTPAVYANYQRELITFTTPSNGICVNNTAQTFPVADNPATITHIGIFDAQTGGNLLYHGELGIAGGIVAEETFSFESGDITIAISPLSAFATNIKNDILEYTLGMNIGRFALDVGGFAYKPSNADRATNNPARFNVGWFNGDPDGNSSTEIVTATAQSGDINRGLFRMGIEFSDFLMEDGGGYNPLAAVNTNLSSDEVVAPTGEATFWADSGSWYSNEIAVITHMAIIGHKHHDGQDINQDIGGPDLIYVKELPTPRSVEFDSSLTLGEESVTIQIQ